jgi:predicted aldo/keto reductase-like oxidoreductase
MGQVFDRKEPTVKLKRREFLGAAVAGTAGLLLGGTPIVSAADVDPTATVKLGNALNACRISAGTGMSGGNRETNQTRMGAEKFEALLNYAYDKGIRQFDLADMYGTHPYVARAMKDKPREEIQYITKIWTRPGGIPEKERHPADVLIPRFLDELQTDYLDLVQIHCMTEPDWTEKERPMMDGLAKLKEEGLIKAHGVSCHSMAALRAAAKDPWVDVVHVRVNPFMKHCDSDGKKEDLIEILGEIHDAGKGVIGMKLIGQGEFDYEQRKETLKWVTELGSVDCLTVGFEKPAEIDEFLENVNERLIAMAENNQQLAVSA